jgi:uncharacterized protein YlxW (UPF0749 family)
MLTAMFKYMLCVWFFLYSFPGSVSAELRDLEAKRQRLQLEVVGFTQRIDELKLEMIHQQTELERLKISVEQVCNCRNITY